MPGRGVTLQMLLEEKMLEPGHAAMTIEYLVKQSLLFSISIFIIEVYQVNNLIDMFS